MEGYFMELTLDEARGLVDEAIAFFMAAGREAALVEFSNPRGRFARGEQYLYALDIDGVLIAHPLDKDNVGEDLYDIRDSEGKSFVKEIVDTARTRGFG